MFKLFPVTDERKEKIKEKLKDENYQMYLLIQLLEVLTEKEAISETASAAKYNQSRAIAKLLRETL